MSRLVGVFKKKNLCLGKNLFRNPYYFKEPFEVHAVENRSGLVIILWHINSCALFNAKFCLYIIYIYIYIYDYMIS